MSANETPMIPPKNAVLLVMSGTGNTRCVAGWMAEEMAGQGISAQILMIDDPAARRALGREDLDLAALLCPTHGFLPPWSMIRFLLAMPRGRGVTVLCGATRGALKFGPLIVPGAAGFAAFLAALISWAKGFRVRAVFSLDMPSNFINFHWGLHPDNVAAIQERSRKRLARFLTGVLDGGAVDRAAYFRNHLWELAWSLAIFWAIPLFPLLYLLVARLFMAKIMFAGDRCVGCGQCARLCPVRAIVMKGPPDRPRPYWTSDCENCMRCMGHCPTQAVEAGHSWAVILYFITAIPVVTGLLAWLRGMWPVIPEIQGYWTAQAVNFLYFWPAVISCYHGFWWSLRVPWIRRLFTVTTLTHVYRRYRHPEIGLTDLSVRRPEP